MMFSVGYSGATVPISGSNKNIEDPEIKTSEQQQSMLGPYRSNEVTEGYLLLNSGDTVFGYISIANVAMNQVQVSFSEKTPDLFKIYTTNDLKGYGYDHIFYEKIKSPLKGRVTNLLDQKSEYLFLHKLIDGPSKLYRLFTLKFSSAQLRSSNNPPYYSGKLDNYYIITNANGESIFTKGRTLKGSLNRIYEDNISITKVLKNQNFLL